MIANVEHHQSLVVCKYGLFKTNDSRVFFIGGVALDQASVKLNDHGEGELFALGIVQAANGLDELRLVSMQIYVKKKLAYYHECIVIWTSDSHGDEALVNSVQDLSNSLTSVAVLVHFDCLWGNVDRSAKLDDGSRSKFVGVEIVHATRDNLDATVGVFGQCTKSHDSHTGCISVSNRHTKPALK